MARVGSQRHSKEKEKMTVLYIYIYIYIYIRCRVIEMFVETSERRLKIDTTSSFARMDSENQEKPHVLIEIRIGHVQNTNQKLYQLSQLCLEENCA